jgi:hypothetical protein
LKRRIGDPVTIKPISKQYWDAFAWICEHPGEAPALEGDATWKHE